MINASAIPSVNGDLDLLARGANEMASRSGRIETLGTVLDSTWRGLEECYRAPESATLIAATAPAKVQATAIARDVYSVSTTLLLFAGEARALQARLRSLRGQATDFTSSAIGDWQADENLVSEHNHLMARVDDAAAAWDDAQRRCANAINDLACGVQYRADNGDGNHSADEFGFTAAQLDDAAVHGGGAPWGTSETQHHPWSDNPQINEARAALGIGAGAGKAAVGLSTMVNVFHPKELATSWGNAAKLAIALNPNLALDDSKGS